MTPAEFAALVRAQVGDRYVLGYEVNLNDPDPHTFDCSELVEWSFARAGVKIRDLASSQYADTSPFTGEPLIGDLVFLRNNPDRPNGIGHVGIYVGDGKIVEAKGRAYGVVEVTYASWKAKSTYAGIRRYPPLQAALQGGDDVQVIVLEKPAGNVTRFWRLRDNKGDFLYTSSQKEIASVVASGWTFEGVAFDITNDPTGSELHRLYKGGYHHLALPEEAAMLKVQGWTDEGVVARVTNAGSPVYRLNKSGAHLFTLSASERDTAVKSGWTFEGSPFGTGFTAPAQPNDANERIAALEAKLDKVASVARDLLATVA